MSDTFKKKPFWIHLPIFLVVASLCQQKLFSADVDGDGMLDSWEQTHFGSLDQGPLGDPDGDKFVNILEYKAGLDPMVSDFAARAGQLYREQWNNIAGGEVADLTGASHFRELPDEVSFINNAEVTANVGDHYGLRLRGVAIAPVTGTYRFYIAADDTAELWIGTDESKFSRNLVASVPAAFPDEGAGWGWAPYKPCGGTF